MLRETIKNIAPRYHIPHRVVEAVASIESSMGRNLGPRLEKKIRDMSVGPMQLLTSTAVWLVSTGRVKDLGVQGTIRAAVAATGTVGVRSLWEVLEDPRTSVELGCAYLRYQLDRYDNDVLDSIAAYNAGSASRTAEGVYNNQAYVDKWQRAYNTLGDDVDGQSPDSDNVPGSGTVPGDHG